MRVVGVDGCRGGWVAVELTATDFRARFHATFTELVEAYPHAACIAIDVPIGLSSDGPRACDIEARRLLGKRRSSVFPAPDPRLLESLTHETASALSRSLTDKGLTIQSFAIFPKVLEVDRSMTRLLQNWIIEVHPEVSFWALASGTSMDHPKGDAEGYEERRTLLSSVLGMPMPTKPEARGLLREAEADDVLDAVVAAWSAQRAARGEAGRVNGSGERDARGRRMEIVY